MRYWGVLLYVFVFVLALMFFRKRLEHNYSPERLQSIPAQAVSEEPPQGPLEITLAIVEHWDFELLRRNMEPGLRQQIEEEPQRVLFEAIALSLGPLDQVTRAEEITGTPAGGAVSVYETEARFLGGDARIEVTAVRDGLRWWIRDLAVESERVAGIRQAALSAAENGRWNEDTFNRLLKAS